MYLSEALGCMASVTLFGRIMKNEGEEEAAAEEGNHNTKDIGILEPQVTPPRKDRYESYYTRAKRTGGLHDLLSRHHRTNGEGVQVPVGDIPQVEGGGQLEGPRSRLQYLVDRAVPLE